MVISKMKENIVKSTGLESAVDFAQKAIAARTRHWEVFASYNKVSTVRFAASSVKESKTFADYGIGIRAAVGGSVGFSSSSSLSRPDIARTIDYAIAASRAKRPDPDFSGLPQPTKAAKLKFQFDKSLLSSGEDELTELGSEPLLRALDSSGGRLDVSGATSFVYEKAAIRSSTGVDCSDESTFMYSYVTAEDRSTEHESSGIGWSLSRFLKGFDAGGAGEEAVRNALQKARPGKITPGKYDVVFGHYAVTDLVEHVLSYAVSLASVDAGITYLGDKMGKSVAVEDFSILDDGTLENSLAAKQCDDEGTATHKTPIIEDGVLVNYLSDDYYAKKMSKKLKKNFSSTGNAFRFDAIPGRRYDDLPAICPTNLVIKPGTLDEGELFGGIKRGIYVGRTWYTYPINPVQGDFTCTNRSNTFLIENGEIVAALPANSFRINDNLPRLLRQITGIGKDTKAVTVWGGSSAVVAPRIKMSGVNVIYSKGAAMGAGG